MYNNNKNKYFLLSTISDDYNWDMIGELNLFNI